jgi:fructose-1,6-bisphosphatase/sedoheptulose 1,7-bisphosphatase-like protein
MSWLDLIVDGTIVQGILALGIVGAWIYTLVVSGAAPEALSTAAMIVLGAFFGTVVERARASIRRK